MKIVRSIEIFLDINLIILNLTFIEIFLFSASLRSRIYFERMNIFLMSLSFNMHEFSEFHFRLNHMFYRNIIT
jgi:hypothetical protein